MCWDFLKLVKGNFNVDISLAIFHLFHDWAAISLQQDVIWYMTRAQHVTQPSSCLAVGPWTLDTLLLWLHGLQAEALQAEENASWLSTVLDGVELNYLNYIQYCWIPLADARSLQLDGMEISVKIPDMHLTNIPNRLEMLPCNTHVQHIIYIHTYVHIHTYIHTYTDTHTCIDNVHTHTYAHTHTVAHKLSTRIKLHICACARTHTRTHARMRAHTHRVYICICLHIPSTAMLYLI